MQNRTNHKALLLCSLEARGILASLAYAASDIASLREDGGIEIKQLCSLAGVTRRKAKVLLDELAAARVLTLDKKNNRTVIFPASDNYSFSGIFLTSLSLSRKEDISILSPERERRKKITGKEYTEVSTDWEGLYGNDGGEKKNSTSSPPQKTEGTTETSYVQKKELTSSAEYWIVDAWNAIAKEFDLPKCCKVTIVRRKAIANLNKDPQWRQQWQSAIDNIRKSPFLQGSKGWRPNIDWLLKEHNMTKVIEGTYIDKPRSINPDQAAANQQLSAQSTGQPTEYPRTRRQQNNDAWDRAIKWVADQREQQLADQAKCINPTDDQRCHRQAAADLTPGMRRYLRAVAGVVRDAA